MAEGKIIWRNPVPMPWGSLNSARRAHLVREIAVVLASGGPIDDEMEAAEQVVERLVRLASTAERDLPHSDACNDCAPCSGFVRCPFCQHILPPGSVIGTGEATDG